MFQQPASPARDDGEAVTLPAPGEDYRAAGRPAAHALPRIHFLLADRTVCFCQYAELDSFGRFTPGARGAGDAFVICFKGRVPTEIVIEGRNLWSIFDSISMHRLPWVRELPRARDFEDERTPVIHRIAFRPPAEQEP